MLRRIITSVPNTLTCMNLLCGALACIFAFSAFDRFGAFRGEQIVWMLIGGAAVFDFFDGAAARLLNAPSPLGKELDSLSDLVSFGMAPAMLLYNILTDWSHSAWIPYISLIIPVMGALRLAKFNLDDSQSTTFKGLPIPANAIFWVGATAWMGSHAYVGNIAMVIIIVAVALLMVTDMRMFSLKLKNFRIGENLDRYILMVAAVAFVAIFGVEVRLHNNPLFHTLRHAVETQRKNSVCLTGNNAPQRPVAPKNTTAGRPPIKPSEHHKS